MKTHKRKKSTRHHGKGMGTSGTGARKNQRKSGHRGGKGMSGSGKRADHKKTLITKIHGHGYFGKKGVTSRGAKKKGIDTINLKTIQSNLESFGKKTSKGWEIDLSKCKILGEGEIKDKIFVKAKEASASAVEKVKKAGGEITLPKKIEKEVTSKDEE